MADDGNLVYDFMDSEHCYGSPTEQSNHKVNNSSFKSFTSECHVRTLFLLMQSLLRYIIYNL